MSLPIPDMVLSFTGDNWGQLGLVPVILWRLLYDRDFEYEEIDCALKELIGPDYAQVNVSTWIDRMIDKGNEEMKHSLEFDEPPVIDVMDHAIAAYLEK